MAGWGLRAWLKAAPFNYAQLRSDTYQQVLLDVARFLDKPLTDLTGITHHAVASWEQQWLPGMPQGLPWSDWDWKAEISNWSRQHDRFELAIWSGSSLCGLAIGKPSGSRENLSIYAMQGCPDATHPLKGRILTIVIEVAEAYGTALKCKELRFVSPLAGAISRYAARGFRLETPRNAPSYCVRPLYREESS
jgi:hypothetical protein